MKLTKILTEILQDKLKERLQEKQRFSKEKGEKYKEDLEAIFDDFDKRRDGFLFAHFTEGVKGGIKVGINPKSQYNTPTGIYSYPVMYMDKDVLDGKVPFKGNARHIVLFTIKPQFRNKVLIVNTYGDINNESAITEKNMIENLSRLQQLAKSKQEMNNFKIAIEDAKPPTVAGKVWNVSRHLANFNSAAWTKILNQDLDIEGVVDIGSGMVHENEPEQAVFFKKDAIKILAIKEQGKSDDPKDKRFSNAIWIAQNPDTSEDKLRQLFKSNNNAVLSALAENPSTPKDILLQLTKNKYYYIPYSLMRNTEVDSEILDVLASEMTHGPTVRADIAAHPKTSTDTLNRLMQDNFKVVRDAAQKSLNNRTET